MNGFKFKLRFLLFLFENFNFVLIWLKEIKVFFLRKCVKDNVFMYFCILGEYVWVNKKGFFFFNFKVIVFRSFLIVINFLFVFLKICFVLFVLVICWRLKMIFLFVIVIFLLYFIKCLCLLYWEFSFCWWFLNDSVIGEFLLIFIFGGLFFWVWGLGCFFFCCFMIVVRFEIYLGV